MALMSPEQVTALVKAQPGGERIIAIQTVLYNDGKAQVYNQTPALVLVIEPIEQNRTAEELLLVLILNKPDSQEYIQALNEARKLVSPKESK